MVIDAAIPFITAAIAWLVLGERESVSDAAGDRRRLRRHGGHGRARRGARPIRWAMLLAFAMAVLMALVIVLIRRKQGVNMVPAVVRLGASCAR